MGGKPSPTPLEGIRVLDCATVLAGPGTTARLGDFGADVIKVEHPRGDTARGLGWKSGGAGLWWKQVSRNKRPVTVDLSKDRGREAFLRLVDGADVVVESFRPGTLERWDLDPENLLRRNPGLIVLRVSGFGQTGPYRRRAGFGTLAEAMSGYAHMSGFPDGPPMLPPIALADEVGALLGAFAVMVALYHRDARGGSGQVIDLSLVESLLSITGPIAAVHQALGLVPGRLGNRIAYAAPRGAFATKDGRWIALSGTSQSIAERVFVAMGLTELAADPRFVTNNARVENAEELDSIIAEWVAQRTLDEAMAAFEGHEAAAAPVYDIADILADPHLTERDALVKVDDDELGDVTLPAPHPLFSATPGRIRHAGLPLGAANAEVFSEAAVQALRDDGAGSPRFWENAPGDQYGRHAHDYHKILFCLDGSITFHIADGDVELHAGDRLDIGPGTEHAASVGPEGVSCVEATA